MVERLAPVLGTLVCTVACCEIALLVEDVVHIKAKPALVLAETIGGHCHAHHTVPVHLACLVAGTELVPYFYVYIPQFGIRKM